MQIIRGGKKWRDDKYKSVQMWHEKKTASHNLILARPGPLNKWEGRTRTNENEADFV